MEARKNQILKACEDMSAKAAHKRYEGLVTVRSKAIKGKGAWYWTHLEPMLIQNTETGLPKAVKLRCALCSAVFSASNPSRTASEHLKRGTCPNFAAAPKPISSIAPSLPVNPKGNSTVAAPAPTPSGISYHASPLAMVDPSRFCSEIGAELSPSSVASPPLSSHHLPLSGGKEDLDRLAMLEDSVKKLKTPKTSPGPILGKTQIDSALGLLADWIYESCGSVSFTCIEHPKFKAFLQQIGLPPIKRREILSTWLDEKYDQAKSESEEKIRDAMFFQLSSDGWKKKNRGGGVENLVNLTLNLPNGTSVFRKALFTAGQVPSMYAEEILLDTINDACGNTSQRCVGIVSNRFKAKALRDLESRHHWMVNLSCQVQGLTSLIKDFGKELPLFKKVADNCIKIANFFNNKTSVRNTFHKYQLQEFDRASLITIPCDLCHNMYLDFLPVYRMLEDILNFGRALELTVLEESYKAICLDDEVAREIAHTIRDMGFWNELEAVHCLIKLIRTMVRDIESEKPLVGQCLLLWKGLKTKVKEWCLKYEIEEASLDKIIEKRFTRNYHPAWSAAFVLDPLYLVKDSSGKYLPAFNFLTRDQEKDVDNLITRLVSRDEAHVALMELMKWRTEGLDPLYAQAVQLKQKDPISGKMKIANPQSSRLVWETYLSEYKSLSKVAVRLIFLHSTSRGFKCNWSFLRWVCANRRSKVNMERAQKMVFLSAHAKLERRDLFNEEEKNAELFLGDDVLNEVFMDTTPV